MQPRKTRSADQTGPLRATTGTDHSSRAPQKISTASRWEFETYPCKVPKRPEGGLVRRSLQCYLPTQTSQIVTHLTMNKVTELSQNSGTHETTKKEDSKTEKSISCDAADCTVCDAEVHRCEQQYHSPILDRRCARTSASRKRKAPVCWWCSREVLLLDEIRTQA